MKRGDWVSVEGKVGWISYKSESTTWAPLVNVRFTDGSSNGYMQSSVTVLDKEVTSEDLQMLQLLAVDTHDQQWFEELGVRSRAADAILQE